MASRILWVFYLLRGVMAMNPLSLTFNVILDEYGGSQNDNASLRIDKKLVDLFITPLMDGDTYGDLVRYQDAQIYIRMIDEEPHSKNTTNLDCSFPDYPRKCHIGYGIWCDYVKSYNLHIGSQVAL